MKPIVILFFLGVISAPIFSVEPVKNQSDEDFVKEKKTEKKTTTKSEPIQEDWELELDKDIEEVTKNSTEKKDTKNLGYPKIFPSPSIDRNVQNLMMDINAAIDLLGGWDKNKNKTTENNLDVRGAEIGFSGAVDQMIRGNLLIAAHNENGEYVFEIHEANAVFPFLLKQVTVKAGKMFLDLGRLNRIHQHDWVFSTAPIVHSKLMDKEAIQDTGAEFNILLPWQKLTQEIVIGATNGRSWGHSHSAGSPKNNPMSYIHLKNFYYIGNNWGTQFGLTAIRYEPDSNSNKTIRTQYGADFLLRWNRSFLKSFMLMGEVWYRETRYPDGFDLLTFQRTKTPMETQVGYYIFADYQFHEQWSLGFRFDYFTIPNLRNKQGFLAENSEMAYTPQVTFKPSEFSFIRLSFERRYSKDLTIGSSAYSVKSNEEWIKEYTENPNSQTSKPQMVTYQVYLQCTFILGSHPPHAY
ncbi:MAG: hypothetical protein L6Q54_04390 [Leptospiraceae bacterium]|nr:hypothetical protein [Leptospiraceae bacterium]MCK6380473.1 hypothetical protein [Leptospiraceae bacterium]NUM42207.1 hypothetical protein [Leptospiraceae bacterium]